MIFVITGESPVLAQTTTTAIPPRLEINAKPGETITKELKIINGTDTLQYYTVNIDDFIVSDTKGTPIPVTSTISGRWSLRSWLTAPEIVPVDAKSTQIVKLNIKVPVNAYPGGHYGMVTYQLGNTKPGELKTTGSSIIHRTGTLVYVIVAGNIKESAQITSFTTPKFQEFGPINFSGSVSNQGDSHITPRGDITVKNFLGQTVAKLPLETGNIFPETNRDFSSVWNQRWGYGQYRATLNLIYGTTGLVLTSTILFWLFPIRLVIYILVLIISVLFVIIALDKKNKHHEAQLEAELETLKKEIEDLEKQKK